MTSLYVSFAYFSRTDPNVTVFNEKTHISINKRMNSAFLKHKSYTIHLVFEQNLKSIELNFRKSAKITLIY